MKVTDNIEKAVLKMTSKFFMGKEMCISIMSESKGFIDLKDTEIVMDKHGVKGIIGQAMPVTICVSKQEIAELFYKKIKKTKNKYYKGE